MHEKVSVFAVCVRVCVVCVCVRACVHVCVIAVCVHMWPPPTPFPHLSGSKMGRVMSSANAAWSMTSGGMLAWLNACGGGGGV